MPLAVQFFEHGTTNVLRVVDLPPLTAGPGQVRVAVRAAGVNPIDWKILRGYMRESAPLGLPCGLGSEMAGVVDQVGKGVTVFRVGDPVLGASITAAYAQSALADPAALVAKPATVPWAVAGTLAGAGVAAWEALDRLKVVAGETLLIHAAAGGVGTFAVQMAVERGIRVIGTASGRNHGHLRSLGAEPVSYGEGLAGRVRSISPRGVDAVLDASGRGEIAASIALAGGPSRVLTLVALEAACMGIQVYATGPGEGGGPALRGILALMRDGRLRVPICGAYSLERAAVALRMSESGRLCGKLVLLVT
ncbi:NADP-dependent oxidoreductase [Streptomyces sp. NPDC127033]|uniref:NADP-dependent oxidoreductase n=1 Tax=Streptomyces sp. NPDC127033 TaxID=3347110 RepID=UPI0036581401